MPWADQVLAPGWDGPLDGGRAEVCEPYCRCPRACQGKGASGPERQLYKTQMVLSDSLWLGLRLARGCRFKPDRYIRVMHRCLGQSHCCHTGLGRSAAGRQTYPVRLSAAAAMAAAAWRDDRSDEGKAAGTADPEATRLGRIGLCRLPSPTAAMACSVRACWRFAALETSKRSCGRNNPGRPF
jgi:hypothetical protein